MARVMLDHLSIPNASRQAACENKVDIYAAIDDKADSNQHARTMYAPCSRDIDYLEAVQHESIDILHYIDTKHRSDMRRANPTIMYHAVLRCASKSIEYLCKQGYAYPENIYEIALQIGDLETIRAIHDGGCRVIVSDKFFDTNMIAPELLEYADLQLHAVNQERTKKTSLISSPPWHIWYTLLSRTYALYASRESSRGRRA